MPGYSRDHNGHITVGESDQRWCSDGLEFKCFNGDTVSMTFVLDCCDREAISFVEKKRQRAAGLDDSGTSVIGCQYSAKKTTAVD